MNIKVREVGNHKVIEIPEDISVYNIDEFKKLFFKELDGRHKSIVVDLKRVKLFDSSLLGALITGLKRMKEMKGELSLLNVVEDVWTVLHLTNLEKVFNVYDSEDKLG
jgi:anti-sigma B factor antagonist